MPIEWCKYPSIENEKVLAQYEWPSHEFVVTEKVDGANFCMLVPADAEQPLEFYTRNLRLGPADSFMGFRSNERLVQRFESLAAIVRDSKHKSGLVYGELFGGFHTKIKAEGGGPSRKPIQKRVEYSSDHHFLAFDFRAEGSAFLGWTDFCELIPEPFRVSALCVGPLHECLSWCVHHLDFRTQFGDDHPAAARTVEGFVLRHADRSDVKFKFRTPTFVDEEEVPRTPKVKTAKPKPTFPASLTRARFLSAVTKIPRDEEGRVAMKHIPVLVEELFEDVRKETGEALDKKIVGWFVREEIEEYNRGV